ncbi:ABC transporter ATP-binding protein [Alteromonas aestuariivivens]|uniref:ABC transporter ATP-binding protein n=1 Tax=Alteromonas aestuariivivens TaxID=1938339 RepID=A0A3D8M7K6_9ALTE|nr:ABC transporter ATP-binding protein [Alteromonas aestuariivivens]RDV25579.1 ABC transporter ATP-binding protein [Alteromonas aestuariivivens]
MAEKTIDLEKTRKLLVSLLAPERDFFWVVIAYSVAIGLLTLAVPIAVQTLINTIVNIASSRAVTVLAVVLFCTLLLSGCFSALRMRVMEYYERRVYARLVAELSLRTVLAPHSYFEGRKNTSITHRYFDIMTLQKNIPSLMVDGIALVLQMLVGFTLVAFYHPFLLAFNLCVLFAMYLIWKIWSTRAKETAVILSESKYTTAKWLNNLASAHTFVKSATQFEYVGKKTEHCVNEYVRAHSRHFSFTFRQVIMFLVLYASASAALLGLGGWLVIAGQLSIGQLVAAELIMSAVFFGIARFSHYLKLYYELYGSADKLGGIFNMPQESLEHSSKPSPLSASLTFHHVTLSHNSEKCELHFSLPDRAKCFIVTHSNWVQKHIVNLLKRYSLPESGWINMGDHELTDLDTYELRQAVSILDRSLIVECTIAEFIQLSAPCATSSQINSALENVGLLEGINKLPLKMQTPLSAAGSPLQPLELILLKLAVVMLNTPRIIILNQHFDAIPSARREALLRILEQLDCTVLYFTNAPNSTSFSQTIDIQVGTGQAENTREEAKR